jgi:hypothetical protein
MTDRAQQADPLPLSELIVRLETAGAGDVQELSAEVARFVGTWKLVGGRSPSYPLYCESLDAAMTLVPEGWVVWDWFIGTDKSSCLDLRKTGQEPANGSADTAARALCAAALKARGQ